MPSDPKPSPKLPFPGNPPGEVRSSSRSLGRGNAILRRPSDALVGLSRGHQFTTIR